MLAIALMVIIVVDFTSSSALGYLSAASRANEIRASYLARSAINVGLALIAQDTRSQQAQAGASGAAAPATGSPGTSAPAAGGTGVSAPSAPFDSYASVWAVPFPPMQVNGGLCCYRWLTKRASSTSTGSSSALYLTLEAQLLPTQAKGSSPPGKSIRKG